MVTPKKRSHLTNLVIVIILVLMGFFSLSTLYFSPYISAYRDRIDGLMSYGYQTIHHFGDTLILEGQKQINSTVGFFADTPQLDSSRDLDPEFLTISSLSGSRDTSGEHTIPISSQNTKFIVGDTTKLSSVYTKNKISKLPVASNFGNITIRGEIPYASYIEETQVIAGTDELGQALMFDNFIEVSDTSTGNTDTEGSSGTTGESPILPICDNTKIYTCTIGIPINEISPVSCGGFATWNCTSSGEISETCSIANSSCPVNGTCNNATQFGCAVGTSSGNIAGSCGGSATWSCLGAYSGTNATNCSKANPTCPTNGLCDNTTQFACSSGSPSAKVGATCGGISTWSCLGSDGGTDDTTCTKTNPLCPIDGSCNLATKYACSLGVSKAHVAGSCDGSATWLCSGTNGGADVRCAKENIPCPVNGTCDNATQFSCMSGISGAYDAGICGGISKWSCLGTGGGIDATNCKINNPPCPIDGSCNLDIEFACTTGISDSNKAGSCGSSSTWNCLGTNGGSSSVCSRFSSACSGGSSFVMNSSDLGSESSSGSSSGSLINGSCDNSTNFACTIGTSSGNLAGSCGGSATWSCLGSGGGTDDLTCTKSNAPCPINGSCDITTNFACTTGTSTANSPGSCGGSATWSCLGANGGTNDLTCTKPNLACVINGSCDNTTDFSCAAGTSSGNLAGSCGGSATWSCLGSGGGSNDTTCTKPNAPCSINGSCDNSTQFGCITGSDTANVAGSCGGSSTWTCLGSGGGSNDTTCAKANPACVVNGSCDNTSHFACTSGTSSANVAGSCGGGSSTWSCLGSGGGTDDTTCTKVNADCSINGACDNSTQFACVTGVTFANVAGSCGGSSTWSCLGSGGGSDDLSCTKSNPACVINGTCDNSTQFACVLGSSSANNPGSCGGVSNWSCLGANGGTDDTTCGKLNPPCPVNGSCNNSTEFACALGTTSANVAGSCGSSSTWSCLGMNGGTDDTTCTRITADCSINGSCNNTIQFACFGGTSSLNVPGSCGGSSTWSCLGAGGGSDDVSCTKSNPACSINGTCDNSTNFACTTGTSSGNLAGSCGGSATWSCLGSGGGSDDLSCTRSNIPCPINGSCDNSTQFACTTGSSSGNIAGSCGGGSSTWSCLGANGGIDDLTCTKLNAPCSINGSCDNSAQFACSAGTTSSNLAGSCGGSSTWSCLGAGGGSDDATCSIVNAPCLVNGACDNATQFACATGTSSGNLAGSCGGSATWSCLGLNGGSDDLTCSKVNIPCPINGTCNNTIQYGCILGTTTANLPGSCGGSAIWSCLGANGGSDATNCTKSNPACAINGACDNTTQFACSVGTSSGNITGACGGTGSSTWSCLGANGGSNDLTCAKLTLPCPVNGVCDNSTQFACTTGTSSGNLAGSCGGSSTWSCLGANGGSDDVSCTKLNPLCIINGVCDNTTNFACITGITSANLPGLCGGSATWSCLGMNGGTNDITCNKANASCPVNGSCDNSTQFACTTGITTANIAGSCGGSSTWSCLGIAGGSDDLTCTKTNSPCPVNGSCDNSTQFACTTGTSSGNIAGSCGGSATWSCLGANGGSNDLTCTKTNSPCPINGSCDNSTQFACTLGTTSANIAGSCGGSSTWSCLGANGGSDDVSCTRSNVACPVPASLTAWSACSGGNQTRTCTEQTGGHAITCASLGAIVGINNQSCGTPATCNNTIQFACASGIPVSTVANNCGQSSTWGCDSIDGGTNTTATACTRANAACINGSCDNSILFACISGTSSGNLAGSCGGSATWSCLSTGGGSDDLTCSKSNPACPVPASVTAWSVCSEGNQSRTCTEQTGGDPITCASLGAVVGINTQSCGTPASVTAWSACSGGNQTRTCTEATDGGAPTCVSFGATPGINNQSCGTPAVCDNTTQFACTSGISVSNVANSCGQSATWGCDSTDGGSNTTATACTRANPLCINGSCDTIFNSYTTPTATCATGVPTIVNGTGPWTWGCNSPNGGTNTTPTACIANKTVDCLGSWSTCVGGTQTYTIETIATNGGLACSSTNGATQGCGTPASCDNSIPLACTTGIYAPGSDNGLVSCNTTRVWGCNSTDGGTNTTATACGKPNSPCAINGTCDNSTQFSCTTGTSSGNLAGSCGGSATWSCLGANGGIDDLTCNKPNAICSVNGICDNSTNFACTTGTSSGNLAGSCGGSATWSCLGVGGGSNDLSCNKPNSPCAINGICDNSTQFSCTTGTSSGNLAGSCGGSATWSCLGSNGGSDDVSCNKPNAICSVNGVCDNSTNFACISGTADLTLVGTCGGSATWSCMGVGGGSDDESCNKANPACPVPASVTAWSACSNGNQTRTCTEQTGGHTTTCASLFAVPGINNQSCGTPAVCDNSIQFACTSGTSVFNIANSCGQSATWGCNSTDGGTNTTISACTRANAACINGSCNATFNSYTTPTATCATGVPTLVSGAGPWTWGCNSPNGGINTAPNACIANKILDCVGSWSGYGSCSLLCGTGSQTRTFTQTTAATNGGVSCTTTYGAENGGTQNQSCNTFSCTQGATCGGSIPANATASTASTYTQTWNGSIYAPTTSWAESQATCDFNCNTNYTSSGSICIANTQSCAITNGVGSQTWNGSSWGTCTVVSCNTYYSQSGNTCVATSLPCSYGGGTVPWGVGCSASVGVVNLSHGGVSGSYNSSAVGYAGSMTLGCNNGSFTSNSESCSCIPNWQDSGSCSTTCGTGTKPQTDVRCGGTQNVSCTDNSGYSSWGGYGACSASCGPGTMTRYNACGGSETVGCNNGACPVNCSYTTYQGGSCSAPSCGNYSMHYTKTVVESNGGTCPISEGQFASWGGGICNTGSVPSGNQAIACSSVAGSYGIPANYTTGTAYYRVETASCLGNYGQVIWTDISGCSAPITGVCSATPETCTYGATAYPVCWTRNWQCYGSNGGGPSGTCSDYVDCSGL